MTTNNIEVSALLMRNLEEMTKQVAIQFITEIATRHGFSADEEIRALGLESITLSKKKVSKPSAGGAPVKRRTKKTDSNKAEKETKKAEKDAEKAAEKAEKEAKKAAEKAEKEVNKSA